VREPFDLIIVGGGLFGSVLAEAARYNGANVIIIDSEQPNAGSKPAACLIKPSWLSTFSNKQRDAALDTLDDFYGLREIQFTLQPTGVKTTLYQAPPSSILNNLMLERINGEVKTIMGNASSYYTVRVEISGIADEEVKLRARRVIVAAGIWSTKLVEQYTMKGQWGSAYMTEGETFDLEPAIKVWAPYKQLVRFNRGDGIWVGDGTALRKESLTDERALQSHHRCQSFAERNFLSKELRGVRPYAKPTPGAPCLFEQYMPGCWIATGGAKNGVTAAGWCATQIDKVLNF